MNQQPAPITTIKTQKLCKVVLRNNSKRLASSSAHKQKNYTSNQFFVVDAATFLFFFSM